MLDPSDHTAHRQTETLRAGPSGPSTFEKVPARWRHPAVLMLVFVLGVAAGVVAVLAWPDPPQRRSPPEARADEDAVELILFTVAPLTTHPRDSESEDGRLKVDSAIVLSSARISTVRRIQILDPSLDVRVPALPVTVSPTTRLRPVDLEIIIRNCAAASRWTPLDRPFTITWRDEYGTSHLDRAGDLAGPMAGSLAQHIDAVCGTGALVD